MMALTIIISPIVLGWFLAGIAIECRRPKLAGNGEQVIGDKVLHHAGGYTK